MATANGISPPKLQPARLAGSPSSPFSIPERELIDKARYILDHGIGVEDSSVLADEFRFEFPVISLDKKVRSRPPAHSMPIGLSLPRAAFLC